MEKLFLCIVLLFTIADVHAEKQKKKRSAVNKVAKRKGYCSPLDKVLNRKKCGKKGKSNSKEKVQETTEEKLEETEEFLR